MAIDLSGKAAVVTGASRGLGRHVAEHLAEHGAHVALVGRTADALRDVQKAITSGGGKACAVPGDVSTIAGVEQIRQQVEAQVGAPVILINAAGTFGPIEPIADGSAREWIDTLMVNMVGHYLTCRAFAGGMVRQGWGRIVNFSSAAALHPPGPLNSAYAVSKAALNQFTRHLAAELAGTGVTANVIHPGDVRTDMWADIKGKADAMGPEGDAYRKWVAWVDSTGGDDPRKAAQLIVKLMSDDAAATTGEFLWIDKPLQAPIASWTVPESSQPWK